MEVILTIHAKERMAAKGITIEQVKNTIQRGAKVKQTDGFEASYTYVKVAFKIIGEKYIVKTVKIG